MTGYAIEIGEGQRCEIVRYVGGARTLVAVVPDASPLVPGDVLRVACLLGHWTFSVNGLCVWTLDALSDAPGLG